MSEKRLRSFAAVAVLAGVAWMAAAPLTAGAPASAPAPAPGARTTPPNPATMPAVATVGPLRILKAELDARAQQALADYRARSGTDIPAELVPMVRRQMLESLVRRDLLMLEARRRNVLASEQEAEQQLRQDPFFSSGGKFDEAKFNRVKMENPAAFAGAIQEMRVNLGARKLMDQLQASHAPPEAELRSHATRALTRASVDFMLLRRSDFNGDYPEPREDEIAAYYRAHTTDFHRAARVTLSIAFVDQPALADSDLSKPGVAAAWTERMRQRADSILTQVRAGRKLEDAAAVVGGARPNQVLLGDNYPGFWRGDGRLNAALFKTPVGTVFPEPVPARSGWLVVRVDDSQPEHIATLREVAREIRTRLRNDQRQNHDDRELHALYDALRDSLKTTAYRVRYAWADTATFDPGTPSAADLDRFYRGHLADYSSFNSARGGVVARPFEEVRAEVQARWAHDKRIEQAGALCEELHGVWARGRRDAALEARLHAREVGPVLLGAPVDTGAAGRVVGDSLAKRRGALGAGSGRSARGWIVFDVYQAVPGFLPEFDKARPQLLARRAQRRDREDEAGARAIYDASPGKFLTGDVEHVTRLAFEPPDMLDVKLTREEVERYHRDHIDKYSAPELVTASHILISPRDRSEAADREARARADSILKRIQDGEDLAAIARKVSDDPATRESGGDLGTFGRGTMLPEFEKAAFSMRAGDVTPKPVKTEVGYHIIKVRDYQALVAEPLDQVYANVSADAALEKADSLAHMRADSAFRHVHDAAQARALGRRLGLHTFQYEHAIGQQENAPEEMKVYLRRIETVKPGQLYPGVIKVRGLGWVISWVDSITAPRNRTWDDAKAAAIEAYRRDAGQRRLEAKEAELDSLMKGGWSFDSLGVLWGGLFHAEDVAAGQPLPGLGAVPSVDTLLFGRRGDDGLAPGKLSEWLNLPGGAARLRTREIKKPDASAVTTRLDNERRVEVERALGGTFEEFKKRYGVRILDAKLKDVALPVPPPAR